MDTHQSGEVCRWCGEPEEEHCQSAFRQFEPVVRPAGCECPPASWLNPESIPPICDEFHEDGTNTDRCARCEHGLGCHTQEKKPEGEKEK